MNPTTGSLDCGFGSVNVYF